VKIVVVSPHRDDAALSLGLTIQAWLAARHTVTVVNCFTRTVYAPFSDAQSLHANDRMSYVTALRLREDEVWQRLSGRGLTFVDLRLKDAPIRLRCAVDDVCQTPVNPEDKAIEKIRKALSALTIDALVLPLAFGDHVDHLTARDAAIACSTDRLPTAFYEDLPYFAGDVDLLNIDARAKEMGGSLAPVLLPEYGSKSETDSMEEAVAKKLRIALCYDSQIDDATARSVAEFSRHYGGRERIWVNPAWLSSDLRASNVVNTA
jgi:LmbE family N-acetylglucosaminyl deacetylase